MCSFLYNSMCHHSDQNVLDSWDATKWVCNIFLRMWPRSWHKERATIVYNFLTIWLFYWPKWAILIGYYNNKHLPQEFWIEWSGDKFERLFTKIQLPLFICCKCSSRIIVIWRQNIHIGICGDAAWKKPFRKAKALEFEKKKGIAWQLMQTVWCGLLYTVANKPLRL